MKLTPRSGHLLANWPGNGSGSLYSSRGLHGAFKSWCK